MHTANFNSITNLGGAEFRYIQHQILNNRYKIGETRTYMLRRYKE